MNIFIIPHMRDTTLHPLAVFCQTDRKLNFTNQVNINTYGRYE